MFETTGIINDEVLKELKNYLVPSKLKIFIKIMVIICALLGLISIFISGVLPVIFFLAAGIFIAEYFYAINKFYKTVMHRMEETVGKMETKYKVYFDEVGAIVNNLDTGAKGHMKYNIFVRFVETPNVYVIFTKANQFIIIFKNCLDEGKVNDFKIFIKEKCENLK
ncbi:YcxB family protein [Clostridium gasigenes]|uniref:YcxB family protein n=1 Tax=Clostridium gasigenes TaxID=94869 RepID=UPI001C0B7DFB|nr:YcxB family protein [Clostridium gasigenes]MBU3107354.1 YcxB family protein [Clostridium gasigenes]